MTRTQQVLTVDEGLVGEECQSRGLNLDDALALESPNRDVVAGELAVWGFIRPEREKFVKGDLTHASIRDSISRQNRRFCARVKRAAFRVLPLVEISGLHGLVSGRRGSSRVRPEPRRPQTPAFARMTPETPGAWRPVCGRNAGCCRERPARRRPLTRGAGRRRRSRP